MVGNVRQEPNFIYRSMKSYEGTFSSGLLASRARLGFFRPRGTATSGRSVDNEKSVPPYAYTSGAQPDERGVRRI